MLVASSNMTSDMEVYDENETIIISDFGHGFTSSCGTRGIGFTCLGTITVGNTGDERSQYDGTINPERRQKL